MLFILSIILPTVLAQAAPSINSSTTGSGSQNPFSLSGTGTGSVSGSSVPVLSGNNGGCPQLQSNCDVSCLSIGSDGCVQCTCASSGSPGPGSLTGGSTLSSSGSGNQTSAGISGNPFSGVMPAATGNLSSGVGIGGMVSGSFPGGIMGSGSLAGGSTLTSSGSNNTAPGGLVNPFSNLGTSGSSVQTSGAGIGGNPFSGIMPTTAGNTSSGLGIGGIAAGSFPGGSMGPGSLTGGSTLTSSGSNNTASGGLVNPFSNPGASGSSVQTSGSMSNFVSGSAGSMSTGNTMTGSGSYAQPAMNNNGCPPFPTNCGSTCATLDKNGCPICTCIVGSNNSSASSLSGSVSSGQTSAGASQNLNGCPVFTNDCTAECVSLDSNGCPVCKCHNTGGSHSGSSTFHGSSSNANGCPTFYSTCRPDCVTLDALGCPICTCISSGSSLSSTTGQGSVDHMTGSQMLTSPVQGSAANNNGCPSFPTNCRGDCVTLDGRGCPLCTCTTGSGNSNGSSSGIASLHNEYNQLNPGAMSQANGCQRFPANCPAACSTSDDNGCPVCTCAAPSSSNPQTSSGQGSADKECPPLIAHCDPTCLLTDSYGCVLCNGDCNESHKSGTGSPFSNSSSGSGPTTASPVQICSPFDANCPGHCASFDAKGCLICTCPVTTVPTSPTTTPSVNPGGSSSTPVAICPAFDGSNCRVECLAMDIKGCLICNCGTSPQPVTTTANSMTTAKPPSMAPVTTATSTTSGGSGSGSGGSSGNSNSCPPFDTSCKVECAAIDTMGCLTCSCSHGTGSSSGSSGGTGSSGSGGTGNNANCPPFDVACQPGCASIDAQGCLHCSCSVTTPASTPASGQATTASPLVPGGGSATTFAPVVPVFPGSGTNTGSGSATTGNGNGCPQFDASCTPGCISMDAMGCMICSCNGGSGNNTSGSGSSGPGVGGAGNTNGCPVFDTSCPSGCAAIDAMGCLTCTCTGTTVSPDSGSGGNGNAGTGSGNANSCPPVDVMACQPSCLILGQNGCVICTCSGTSPSSSVDTTTSLPTTTVYPVKEIPIVTNTPLRVQPTTQPCPAFDATCPAQCASVDSKGCPRCSCPASPTTKMPVTSAPTTVASTSTVSTPSTTPTIPPTTPTRPSTTPTPTSQSTSPLPTSQSTSQAPAMTSPLTVPQTTRPPGVCPPMRCVYPCDAGVSLGTDNCPVCKCRSVTTTASP